MYYDPGSSNLNTELSSMTPPDPPTREKKIPFEFTFKHFVIFMVLFVLMLVVLYVVEMAGKTSREAEWQKRRPAEDFCITHGLNRTNAELDNCIQNFLGLSALFEAGMTAEEIVESLGSPSYATEVSQRSATEISQSYATQTAISQSPLRATETMQSLITQSSSWSATQLSQIRQRATEASQG